MDLIQFFLKILRCAAACFWKLTCRLVVLYDLFHRECAVVQRFIIKGNMHGNDLYAIFLCQFCIYVRACFCHKNDFFHDIYPLSRLILQALSGNILHGFKNYVNGFRRLP